MKKLYMKQSLMSVSGKFSVTDAEEKDVYIIEGSFLKIPKHFKIMDPLRKEVAVVTNKPLSFMPTFLIEVEGQQTMTIKKQLSFLKARYSIDAKGIDVQGDWWDMDFQVYENNNLIGAVSKKWFTMGDRYELEIADEEKASLLVALVVAIDYVKASQGAAVSASM